MSDDLMQRLRDKYTSPQDVAEAADRIEQLEAALREVLIEAEECPCNIDTDPFIVPIQIIARKALEGKDV